MSTTADWGVAPTAANDDVWGSADAYGKEDAGPGYVYRMDVVAPCASIDFLNRDLNKENDENFGSAEKKGCFNCGGKIAYAFG